ncbi:VOC family protein [Actinacidiphila rubida]|uniref:Glyoxalase superfamily enzyme, possibly 3-demethylubiquinone-9 3-methyltransferase n=1 Tax=Actinacidiphila rubida TaxID=310780 RepID=A0A1H8N6F2_9ACTN|nr:VOC family protein [Actinacidiphila rubida]SEO25132.1 Glyoxalase superfamily enzyme, possibly 3-demethylubiquinone-9 3-methyltransferase [Actinacidiphila rubida]
MTTGGLTTCLWFDGQAEEAADFYLSVFKDGTRGRVSRYTEAGPGEPGSVLGVEFTVNGQKFVAINGGPEFTFNEAVSFQIPCADQAEVDYYWSRLAGNGGEEVQCGWLKDRFGVSWQVVPDALLDFLGDPDGAKAAATARAMFTMKKLDIASLTSAHAASS